MFSDLLSLLLSKEVILLILLLGGFIYLMNQEKDLDNKDLSENLQKTHEENFDIMLMVSLIIFSSAFVLGILFSDKLIKFLMSVSQLASVGLFLNKIKTFFIGKSLIDSETVPQKMVQTGGGMNLYDDVDEMPYEADSDDEDF